MNIALIERGRSEPGVVYASVIGCIYWGRPGLGAFSVSVLGTKPLKSDKGENGACRVVARKSHLNRETQAFIDRAGLVSLVQACNSLKFCRVAEGKADIYPCLAPTCEWDTAAAQATLEGADGVVLNRQGTLFDTANSKYSTHPLSQRMIWY